MSLFLAVVSSVAPVVSASPSPSLAPVIINHTSVQTVYALSPAATKALQLALLFFSGVGASLLHQILEAKFGGADGWSRGVNIALQTFLGVVVAGLSVVLQHGTVPNLSDVLDFATTFLIVVGSSQSRYQFYQWTSSLGTDNPAPEPPAPGSPEQVVPTKAGV